MEPQHLNFNFILKLLLNLNFIFIIYFLQYLQYCYIIILINLNLYFYQECLQLYFKIPLNYITFIFINSKVFQD